jgi:hypothetical protein
MKIKLPATTERAESCATVEALDEICGLKFAEIAPDSAPQQSCQMRF